MDDIQIELLQAHGYDYVQGAIVDAAGNYLQSVELAGENLTSEVDENFYKESMEVFESVKKPKTTPEAEIEAYKKDPITNTLSDQAKEYYPIVSEREYENGVPTYDDVETFMQEEEKRAMPEAEDSFIQIARGMQEEGYEGVDDAFIEDYKKTSGTVKKYQKTDADVDTIMNNILKEEDNNSNIFDSIGDWMFEKIYAGIKYATPTGTGMDGTPEEKKEYKEAVQKKKELQKPIITIADNKLKEKEEALEAEWEKMSLLEKFDPTDKDNRLVEFALGEVKTERERLDAFVNEDLVYNPFNRDLGGDLATFGLGDAYDEYAYKTYLNKKITAGEQLTPKEQLAAETLAGITGTKGIEMEQTGLYGLTQGTFESAMFLVGGAPGRLVMRGATKAVTRGVSKAATKALSNKGVNQRLATELGNYTGKIAGEGVNMAGQAVLHPNAHVDALNKYHGDIFFATDDEGNEVIMTDRRDYKTLKEELDITRNDIQKALAATEDPETKGKLKSQLKKIDDTESKLIKPTGALDAIAYGVTEVLKENIIENYGGRLALKTVNNRFTRKGLNSVAAKPWAQGIAKSKAVKGLTYLDNMFGKAKSTFNNTIEKVTGKSATTKLVGSNAEEIMEEVVTQTVPVWGETEEEAIARKGELLELGFYGQVAGQTFLMGRLMKGATLPMKGYNRLKNAKDIREKRGAFRSMIAEMKVEGLTDAKVEEVLMQAGQGKYTVQEYNNKIKKLRDKGQHSEANNIERNKTFNIGKSLVEANQGKKFVREMESMIAKGKIPSESVAAVQEAVQEVKVLEQEMSEHGNLRNRDYVLELKSKDRYTKKQIKALEEKRTEILAKPDTKERQMELDVLEDSMKDLKSYEGKVNKAIRVETSPKMVKKLQAEAEVTNDLIKAYDANVKEGTGYQSISKKEAVEKTLKKYGTTISGSVRSQALKNLESHILQETITEKLKDLSAPNINTNTQTKENKPEEIVQTPDGKVEVEEQVPEPLQEHVQEIGNSIDEVTQIAQEQEIVYGEDVELQDPDATPDLQDPDAMDTAFFDEMPKMADGSFENEALDSLAKTLKKRSQEMEERDGDAPTFTDYIEELLDTNAVPLENLRGHMRGLALGWSAAGLGKPGWRALYKDIFENVETGKKIAEKKLETEARKIEIPERTPAQVEEDTKTEIQKTNEKTSSEPVKYIQGKPIHTTANQSKTYGTEHKPNYSAIEFQEVVEEVDGKKVYKRVNAPIPKANRDSSVNWWDLVNPNKNNPGDVLTPTVLEGAQAANTIVSVRDSLGRKTGEMTFNEWVDAKLSENGMSFEDFQNTKEYQDKVPMVYVDSNGSQVAYVPEVEWFNGLTVGDSSLETDEEIDIENLTPSHQKVIEENREQASALRAGIIRGDVTGMEIVENLTYPPLQKIAPFDVDGNAIPLKTLNEVHPDSQIVWMKAGGNFVDLNDNEIDFEQDIINIGDYEGGLKQRELKEIDGVQTSVAINKDKSYFLSHIATVDGKKKYIAINTTIKKEPGKNTATEQDVETARWIAAVNKITKFGTDNVVSNDPSHPLYMTPEQAEDIRRQVEAITGHDIKTKYREIIEALISYQPGGKGPKKFYVKDFGNKLLSWNKETKALTTSTKDYANNVSLNFTGKTMVTIRKEGGKFIVEKASITPKMVNGEQVNTAETYEDFLRERFSTNVMGYNVGTTENPVFTVAPQQKFTLRPIVTEKPLTQETLQEQVEDKKQDPKVVKKVEEVKKKEEPGTKLSEEAQAKRKVAMENATALAARLNLDIRDINETDEMVVAEMTTVDEVEKGILNVPGLTLQQEEQIINELFSRFSEKNVEFEDVKEPVLKEMMVKVRELSQSIAELQEFNDNEVVQNMISSLEMARDQAQSVVAAIDELTYEASVRAVNVNFITDEFEVEEWEENEKNFSKSASETKSIDKVGTALKRVFAQIKDGSTGFLGVNTRPSFKQMYDTVTLALSADVELKPNFNVMMSLLEKNKDSTPWMKPLIEKLKASDEQTKNQFVYNTYQQKVYAKFATLSYTGKKEIDSRIYSSNANEATRTVQENWKENFKRSPINNDGKINKEVLKRTIETWNSWVANGGVENQTNKAYQDWLGTFGIQLSEGTLEGLRRGELNISKSGGKLRPAKFEELFEGFTGKTNPNRTGSLFTSLVKYASLNGDKKEDVEFYEKTTNHPFDDMGTILKQLAELEVKYNPTYGSTSRYVSGKSVSEMESYTYFYEQVQKLQRSARDNKKELEKLKALSFSKDSYLLDLLMNDTLFAEQFNHGLVDLMALKDLYKSSPMFAGIDELSGIDYMFAQRAMFQDRKQGGPRNLDNQDFDVRPAHMNTLTNSDKGRMMLLKTAVFDLYAESDRAFEVREDGEVVFTEALNNLVYSQLIMPEMRRMVNYMKKGKKTNIKSYDKGAARFNIFPVLNTITDDNGNTIQDIIRITKGKPEEVLAELETKFKIQAANQLAENVIQEARQNVSELTEFQKKVDKFNNKNYLQQREGSVAENMLIAELDFTLNSMMTNMNYMQLVAGDPALYYKSKIEADATDLQAQEKISKQLAINLGKRMAAMIAPGSVLADSDSNSYMQVFLDDLNGPAENLDSIISWHYGEEALQEKVGELTVQEMIEEVKKGNRDYIKPLQNKFSRIAEFIDIESTDAQEYTTLKEHLYVMDKQGRISKELKERIEDKIEKGEDLTKEELGIVLQPIKPVYTGTLYDADQDVNRMLYIKSSSFPLIPQLTKNLKLDKLRENMEAVEKAYPGKTVRASYSTANKVGGLTSENMVTDMTQPIQVNQMLELQREHFKIQQDVPYKSDKVGDDTVSMGTQIFKLLMGDGIMEMEGFIFEGKEMSGKELQEEFHQIFADMVGIKKEKFLRSLGFNKNMESKDSAKSMEKLQKLLLKEAKSRGFSKQDLKILDLIDGKNGKTFKLPLWLTGNSNKYEAMLNALINNKIFKQKIPGNKFVTGSEAGFEMQEGLENIEPSRIIRLGNYDGGVLKSTNNAEGGITKAQVLLPSKFKLGGKLIDLFEEYDGNQGVYLTNVDGVIKLKEDMVSKELLDQFVFRIPTSSHGLGSSIEVAGFLPPESGDLIVTPKGFVAQMGQDFDIDSLTAYQYHHLVMEDGSIKKLTAENKDAYIKEKVEVLDAMVSLRRKGNLEAVTQLADNIEGLGDISAIRTDAEFVAMIDELKAGLSKDFDLSLLENKFIEVHNAVYSNPKSQPLINKVLSMATAEDQADDIEALTAGTSNTFNILSPQYQMMKMNAGSTGQDAIGIYAKGVTLHSLIQQAKSLGNNIRLGKTNTDGEILKDVQIGNLKSDGVFGKTTTLESPNKLFKGFNRRITTVLDERTNTGTDNEKAQILGRTGLNHKDAIAVDSLLSLLGFDLEYEKLTEDQYDKNKPFHRKTEIDGKPVYYTEYSIPYLFHSQPIIKEYFALINRKNSQTTATTLNAKEEALQELLSKYRKDKETTIRFGKVGKMIDRPGKSPVFESHQDNSIFTGKRLANQVALDSQSDPEFQLQVLATYVDLVSEAGSLKEMMGHVDLNNLGKSMWEAGTKAEEFREYFSSPLNRGIIGAEHLIGKVKQKEGDLEEGQLLLGKNKVLTPTTNQGVMVGTALALSESLFSNVFPAKNEYINHIIKNIIGNSNVNAENTFALFKAKEQIFQEVKKYLTSAEGLGVFNKSAQKVREELMFDDDVNGQTSLSTYVGNLKYSNDPKYIEGLEAIKTNLFINLLRTEKGENGRPSTILFNNQESFDANQEAIYTSVKELIAMDMALPPIVRNGQVENYSTRKLVQDLTAYSYASGGVVQKATQFHKFLPIEYLDDMTYVSKTGKRIPISERLRNYNTFNQVKGNHNILGNFERQYFQNNPDAAVQVVLEETSSPGVFIPKAKGVDVDFLAKKEQTKSKLKQDKWKLYERIEGTEFFREIPVLGDSRMDEYEFIDKNSGAVELTSSIVDRETVKPYVSAVELKTIEHDKLGTIPASGSSTLLFLNDVISGKYGDYSNVREMAEYISQFISPDNTFDYTDKNVQGVFGNGKVYINPDNIASKNDLAITFMHEVMHSLTVPYINEHVDEFGELKDDAPAELQGIQNVFNQYKAKLEEENSEEYNAFKTKWQQYNKEKTQNIPSIVEFSQEEIDVFYPTVNIKEFIATALGNNKRFKEVAGNMPYLESGQSIIRKFGHFITNFIKRLARNEGIPENSVALQAMAKSMDVVEAANQPVIPTPVEQEPEMSPEEMKAMMESYGIEPDFQEESGPDLNDPTNDIADENSESLLPMMKITKNKCK